jgi:hypothetical protein
MFKKIEKPAACEMRSVIRFLNARNKKPADIHHQLCKVYGEHAMNDVNMCMIIRGAPDRVLLMICCVQWKRRFKKTDDSPFRHFLCILNKLLRTLLHEILSDKFRFRNLCVRWVAKLLTDGHKMKEATWHA